MSKSNFKNIAYLENSDFDENGNIINPDIPKDKPVVIMIQSSWCGYCKKAAPAFQDFANENKGVFCATIQADGERSSEQALGKRIKDIKPDFKGFPDYVKYKNNKNTNKQIRGRSIKDLEEFSSD